MRVHEDGSEFALSGIQGELFYVQLYVNLVLRVWTENLREEEPQ